MTDAYEDELYTEDVDVGDESPTLVIEDVSRDDFVKYVGASGDFARIHYDEPFAKDAGYPAVFAPGMMTTGFASHLIADWLGLANVDRFRTRMVEQVFPGDTLTIAGTVVDTDEESGTVDVEFEVTNQDEEAVITGDASATLPSRSD
jgi:acyl dehydratase